MSIDVKHMSVLQDFADEHNKLRMNPRSFIPALQDRVYRLDKHNRIVVKPGVTVKTVEGSIPILEAIEFLEKVTPIPGELQMSATLCNIAQQHAEDLGSSGLTGHLSSDSRSLSDRFDRFVEDCEYIGENIAFGYDKTARDFLLDLLVDDGVADRSHRTLLFNTEFDVFGVGYADHSTFDKCLVINYAKNLVPIDQKNDILKIEDDCFDEILQHCDGFFSKYISGKFEKSYSMERKYTKCPPTSESLKQKMAEKKARKYSHEVPEITKIPKTIPKSESNESKN